MWNDLKNLCRDEYNTSWYRWGIVLLVIFSTAVLGTLGARLIPVEERKIIREERIIVPKLAADPNYQKIKDSKEACHGAPVMVITKDEGKSQNEDDKLSYTWLQVKPLGDVYTVMCYFEGGSDMRVGDVVSLPQGKVTGLE